MKFPRPTIDDLVPFAADRKPTAATVGDHFLPEQSSSRFTKVWRKLFSMPRYHRPIRAQLHGSSRARCAVGSCEARALHQAGEKEIESINYMGGLSSPHPGTLQRNPNIFVSNPFIQNIKPAATSVELIADVQSTSIRTKQAVDYIFYGTSKSYVPLALSTIPS